jgi:hypothetical protein
VTLDCKAIDSMPNISFNIGGKVISLPVGSYAYQVGTRHVEVAASPHHQAFM